MILCRTEFCHVREGHVLGVFPVTIFFFFLFSVWLGGL